MSRQRPHLILIFLALLAVPAAAQQIGVQWQHDIESAKAAARQTGKLVLVHFWTPSCGPCLMLDQNVFNQPGVSGAIESKFVPVKLNANENSATATGFGITRVPTDVIITPDGHVVGKLISPPTPAAYVAELTQVAAEYSTKPGQAFAKAAEAAPVPSQLNSAYANLQIAPNTVPALQAQPATVTNDRYAMAPFTGTGAANAPPAGGPGLMPTIQSGTSSSFTPTLPPANAAPIAAHALSQPGAAAIPSPYDQYAPGAALNAAVPTSAPPTPIVNPYTGPPAILNQPALAAAPQSAGPSLMAGVPPQVAPILPSVAAAPQTPAPVAVALQPTSADARTLPPNAPPLGFEGYCPVSMRTQWKWVPGDPRWGIVHRGRTYQFAGQNEQQQFWADPDRFSPALSGMDPVMAIDHKQQVPGKREHSIDYDNLFYMFSSEATLQQFTANPERYATSVRQAMGIERGRLVR